MTDEQRMQISATMTGDAECDAISLCLEAFEACHLDPDQAHRVADYLRQRFEAEAKRQRLASFAEESRRREKT